MITYYLIGNWMGPFRTVSTTSTHKEFEEWAKKNEFTKRESGKWLSEDNTAYVVIEKDEPDE